MGIDLDGLERMVSALLVDKTPTQERIRELINQMRPVSSVTDDQAEQLAKRLEEIHCVSMRIGSKLEEAGFEKWLDEAKKDIDPYYWNRYKNFLGHKGFSSRVLATMGQVTDRILGLLENPKKEQSWDRRGMVVGHVQAGKTANYTGLICKAADAGYKVIIVIAGSYENLRIQTQERLDEGFVGFTRVNLINRELGNVVGVGRYDFRRKPCTFTNSMRDFDKQTATGIGIPLVNLTEPAVFVIKKNIYTLNNLLEWLREHNAHRNASLISAPMLLIDDEADNASINIRAKLEEISRINGQIRKILEIFSHSCYVGYTATPFANIFIDPATEVEMFGADLFPRDFIVSLDPPDNYFGASDVFSGGAEEDAQSPFVRYIDDHAQCLPLNHLKNHEVVDLPESLKTAVRAFVVARAIRLARGHAGKHNSMLVNASRFVGVQGKICAEIHAFMEKITDSIKVHGSRPPEEALRVDEILKLHQVFANEYENGCKVSWSAVQNNLWDVVSTIKVIEINSKSSDSLDYKDSSASGLNVIAVGGYSLSRGLTLEGLIVSYFLRKSVMYDTLMQMGRWFGYRPEYEDLCRIWMPEEIEGWYAHIAESIEELRDELRHMEVAKATPKQFGLKVRSHPAALIVTARNKMGSGQTVTVSLGLSNRFIETSILRYDAESLDANRRAVVSLVEKIREKGFELQQGIKPAGAGSCLVNKIPVDLVCEFLRMFRNHDDSILTKPDLVRQYIEGQAEEWPEWDVYFPGIEEEQPNKSTLVDDSLGFALTCQRRSSGDLSIPQRILYITNNKRVCSRGTEKIGLTEEQIEAGKAAYRETNSRGKDKAINFPDHVYRAVRKKPLLVIHLLAILRKKQDVLLGKEKDVIVEKPVVAWSISFPKVDSGDREEPKIDYVANANCFREQYGESDESDEDEEGDDVD